MSYFPFSLADPYGREVTISYISQQISQSNSYWKFKILYSYYLDVSL